MENNNGQKKLKLCKRCKKNLSKDIICTACKVELLNNYDSKIDWQTAFEIERIQQAAMRYIDSDNQ
ncbi:MAG: hypothetical protein JXB00_11025 [Bacteroidales bacterium]|nr:hypothetical protein [Bacteroidales bacterium]